LFGVQRIRKKLPEIANDLGLQRRRGEVGVRERETLTLGSQRPNVSQSIIQTQLVSLFLEQDRCQHELSFFVFFDILIKIAFKTFGMLMCEGALSFALAIRTCDDPACPSAVRAAVHSMIFFRSCGRADAEFVNVCAAHFSAAFFELPAILFHDPR
jgi:hypothetical protein